MDRVYWSCMNGGQRLQQPMQMDGDIVDPSSLTIAASAFRRRVSAQSLFVLDQCHFHFVAVNGLVAPILYFRTNVVAVVAYALVPFPCVPCRVVPFRAVHVPVLVRVPFLVPVHVLGPPYGVSLLFLVPFDVLHVRVTDARLLDVCARVVRVLQLPVVLLLSWNLVSMARH